MTSGSSPARCAPHGIALSNFLDLSNDSRYRTNIRNVSHGVSMNDHLLSPTPTRTGRVTPSVARNLTSSNKPATDQNCTSGMTIVCLAIAFSTGDS